MPGYRFGHFTVVEATDERKGTSIVWRCRCDCGNEVLLKTTNIRLQTNTDCGCRTKFTGRAKDLTGQRFGKLVVLSATDRQMDSGSIVWHCKCDCGNEADISARRLTRGKVRSCGCLSNPPVKDYIGKRFGRLTVIEYMGKMNKNSSLKYWKCRCDCGNEVIVGQTELQSGESQSCGCYQKERLLESLQLIEGTSVTILKYTKDHLKASNKSGYTGVFYDKRTGKWIAKINFKKKSYWLGRYDDKEDAIKARQRGEEMRDRFLEWYYAEFKIQDSGTDAELQSTEQEIAQDSVQGNKDWVSIKECSSDIIQ